MPKKLLFASILILTLNFNPFFGAISAAANPAAHTGGLADDLTSNLEKQAQLRENIAGAQNQKRTLASQIELMENQIELTGLKIDEADTKLTNLNNNIADTVKKLASANKKYDHMVVVADARIRDIYKEGFTGPLDLVLSSQDINSLLIRQKYADSIHQSDVNLMGELKQLKDSIAQKKSSLDKDKQAAQKLKDSLISQQNALASQKSQRAGLLAITKNNEATYQNMLAQAQAEAAAIIAALHQHGVSLGPVKRGSVIAFQGNTGCSTGTHLHFGYIRGGVFVDPMPYLRSGYLGWPEANPSIFQYFGANPQFYGSGGHNGIDMGLYYGAPIKAAADGNAELVKIGGCYRNSSGNLSWYPAAGYHYTGDANLIKVNHYDGSVTWYMHVQ